jgi:hypothetical protein
MSRIASGVEALRVGVQHASADITQQQRYEYWLKRSTWKARGEALPLAVGIDP